MARWLKQSTSVDVPIGPFLDPTDGVTPETGLTITQPDVRLKKNGAAWAQKNAAQTLSHEENGFYEVTLDATDTNTLGLLRLAVFESGAAPVWEDFEVVPANVWDSLFGADLLQVDATQILGTTISTPATAGILDVNVKNIADTAAASLGVTTFPGGTLASTTNITAGTITTVTNLTNAPTAGDFTATMKTSITTAVPTAAAIADAVWEEQIEDHSGTSGSTAERLDGIASAGTIAFAVGEELISNHSGTAGSIGAVIGAIDAKTTNLPSDPADASVIAGRLDTLDTAVAAVPASVVAEAVDGTTTLAQSLRLSNSALGGKLSGAGTGTETVRDLADSKDRLVYTVDNDGNRTAVARTLT